MFTQEALDSLKINRLNFDPTLKNEAGKKYGRLLVLEKQLPVYRVSKGARWVCKCDCGKETVVTGYHLRIGRIKSCGCYRKDFAKTQPRGGQFKGFIKWEDYEG